ncbi:hypothetical protein Tco_0686986 [Tanacetum coccineum]
MCSYLKNMEGKKLKDFKNKSFDSIQKMFDRAFTRVNTFVDFRTNLMEGSSKRAGEELEQESTKKHKVDKDKDTTELQSLMEVIPDEEEVAIDVVPLATKSPKIVDWKIHKEGKKSYYQIVRANGKSQMYMIFSQMLKSFNREDLEDLCKLVKARYGSTRPVESMDYLLWNDLKTITFLDDAVYADLHADRKEISSYTTYNYRYAEQEASGVNAASEEVSTAELVSTDYDSLVYKRRFQGIRSIEVGPTSFKPGNLVYLRNDASRAKEVGKLGPKWEVPYEVTEALGKGAYKLRDHDGKQLPRTWNVRNLKKCYVYEM